MTLRTIKKKKKNDAKHKSSIGFGVSHMHIILIAISEIHNLQASYCLRDEDWQRCAGGVAIGCAGLWALFLFDLSKRDVEWCIMHARLQCAAGCWSCRSCQCAYYVTCLYQPNSTEAGPHKRANSGWFTGVIRWINWTMTEEDSVKVLENTDNLKPEFRRFTANYQKYRTLLHYIHDHREWYSIIKRNSVEAKADAKIESGRVVHFVSGTQYHSQSWRKIWNSLEGTDIFVEDVARVLGECLDTMCLIICTHDAICWQPKHQSRGRVLFYKSIYSFQHTRFSRFSLSNPSKTSKNVTFFCDRLAKIQ